MNYPGAITHGLIVLCCCILTSCGSNKSAQTPVISPQPAAVANKVPIVRKLTEQGHLPIAERIALYRQLKKDSPEAYDFTNETELTMYGYRALWNNEVTEAIEIFKLIVDEFPHSANAYDSLGEAYLAQGDMERSLLNYRKTLQMNPDNFHAEDQIEHILFPEKKAETPAEKFAKVFPAEAYKEDLDQMATKLMQVHPNALKFITKEALWRVVEQKKALITDHTTFGEFMWHCSEIIASVHCSHTGMGSFYTESIMLPVAKRFPLQTRLINQQLFIVDPLNNGAKTSQKAEILRINGMPVQSLIADIYRHIPAQGYIQTTKRIVFNTWSTCLIPYALGFPETYEIELKGQSKPIVLNKAETDYGPYRDQSLKICENELCLEMLEAPNTALLTISSFNYYSWNNLLVFQQFIDSSFQEIRKKGIQNLVIDVRLNGGGSQEASIYLLRYLLDKPFVYYAQAVFEGKTEKIYGEDSVNPFENRYTGKLYFIQDGKGNSTTGHFMSLVKKHKLGPIIGEELGSNQFCSAGQTTLRLKHTKLEYGVANNTHESTATALPDEVGILPDHEVYQNIDEYFNKVDAVTAFALKLITK